MQKYRHNWLIIFVIHDFEGDSHIGNIDKIIKDEIKSTGLVSSHAFLLIQKSITHPRSTEIQTVVKVLREISGGNYDLVEINKQYFDFHSERGWFKLLRWVNDNFPANHICLNVLSHGAAFGILGDEITRVDSEGVLTTGQDVKFGRTAFIEKRFIHSGSTDAVVYTEGEEDYCKTIQMLWFSELSEAIRDAFNGQKLDILILNNCYVQSFETGWILCDQVRYLVAPEAWFTSFGYNYEQLLKNLNANPQITPEELLANFINEFKKKWKKRPGNLELIGISIVDLIFYNEMKRYFDLIATILVNMSDQEIRMIVQARQQRIDNVSNLPPDFHSGSVRVAMIDLIYFYEVLVDLFPERVDLYNNISEFSIIFRRALIGQYVGGEYIKSDAVLEKKFNLHGVSVFLPFNTEESKFNDVVNCAYFGKPVIDKIRGNAIPLFLFTHQSQWDDFVLKYLKND